MNLLGRCVAFVVLLGGRGAALLLTSIVEDASVHFLLMVIIFQNLQTAQILSKKPLLAADDLHESVAGRQFW